MDVRKKKYETVDEYIDLFGKEVQSVLLRMRKTVKEAEPKAKETISYRIPTYVLDGKILIYFAAFTSHIGVYPPAPKEFRKEVAKYAGPRGNLKFPLDEPIPYGLVKRIVKFRARQITKGRSAA